MNFNLLGLIFFTILAINTSVYAAPSQVDFQKWAEKNNFSLSTTKVLELTGIEAKVPQARLIYMDHSGCKKTRLYLQYSSISSRCFIETSYDLGGELGFEPAYLNVGIDGQLKRYPIPNYVLKKHLETDPLTKKLIRQHFDYQLQIDITDEMLKDWKGHTINGMTISTSANSVIGLFTSKYPSEVTKLNKCINEINEYKSLE